MTSNAETRFGLRQITPSQPSTGSSRVPERTVLNAVITGEGSRGCESDLVRRTDERGPRPQLRANRAAGKRAVIVARGSSHVCCRVRRGLLRVPIVHQVYGSPVYRLLLPPVRLAPRASRRRLLSGWSPCDGPTTAQTAQRRPGDRGMLMAADLASGLVDSAGVLDPVRSAPQIDQHRPMAPIKIPWSQP